jgi:hypothetical protein
MNSHSSKKCASSQVKAWAPGAFLEGPDIDNLDCLWYIASGGNEMYTPWGRSRDTEVIAPGVVFYSTASHGGYHVAAKLNKRIPAIFRAAAEVWSGKPGWYEEDCAYAIVHAFLPEFFSPEEVLKALETIKRWYPTEWAKYAVGGENAK